MAFRTSDVTGMGARFAGNMVFLWRLPSQEARQKEFHFVQRPPQSPQLLHEAISLFLAAKDRAGYQKRYIVSLKHVLRRFEKEARAQTVRDATHVFEPWMLRQNWRNTSLASNLGRMSSFFRFAVNRKWIERNPCEVFEKPRIFRGTPQTLTVEQAETALRWTAENWPEMLGYLVLAMFCGVRPEELEKVGWGAVDLSALCILIPAEASKVSRRRICPIAPNAAQWLKLAESKGSWLPVTQSTRKRFLKELRVQIGFATWPQDILRHTAASYMLARVKDAGQVALWLGNSQKILLGHYVDMVKPEQAESFWRIVP